MTGTTQPPAQRLDPTPRAGAPRLRHVAWVALAVLLAGAGVYLLYLSRGISFWEDEWDFLLFRSNGDLRSFLEPHNNHLSLAPVAIYKLLFATVGIDNSAPYRLVVVPLHLLVCGLLSVYTSRRVSAPLALLATALLLFLGPAWQNIIWPFQSAWLVSLAAGLGALLALDRRDRRGDTAACLLLGLSISSSGLGLPLAFGILVELALRREPRRLWIVALPTALYALWYLGYGESSRAGAGIGETPQFVAEAVATTLSALLGVGGDTVADGSEGLDWGRPLAIVTVALITWRLCRIRRVSPRVAMLLSTGLSFWVLTALSRGAFAEPWESRYLYVGGLVIVLIGVELASGLNIPRPGIALLACAVVAAVVSNLGTFANGADLLRSYSAATRARAAALDIARPVVDRNFLFVRFGEIQHPAGAYYDAVDAFGSFGDTPQELLAEPQGARYHADDVLVRALGIRLTPQQNPPSLGTVPTIDGSVGGTARTRGSCVAFRPDASADGAAFLDLELPGAGLRISAASGSSTEVSVRRFGVTFQPPLGVVADGAAILRAPSDNATQPWLVRVTAGGPVRACGLGG